MANSIYSSLLLNVTVPVTLSVNKQGEYHATLEGYSGKHNVTVNIFEPPLIFFAIENIKKNSHWQIKGDQLIHIYHIDGYIITDFTITCKSISSVPYLDNNGNWVTQNFISSSRSSSLPTSSITSIITPIINSFFTSNSSSSETTESITLSSATSSATLNHHDKEIQVTGVSRDTIPKQFDRAFLCLVYHFIIDNSHPLHNDITIDWENEDCSKKPIQEKLNYFHDPSHYSYVSKEDLTYIHNQYSTFPSYRYQSKSPISFSSSITKCNNTFNNDHNQEKQHQQQKRKHSETTIDGSDEKYVGSLPEWTHTKTQKSHH